MDLCMSEGPDSMDLDLPPGALNGNNATSSPPGVNRDTIDMGDAEMLFEAINRACGTVSRDSFQQPKIPLTTCTLPQLCGRKTIEPVLIPEGCRGRTHFTRIREWADKRGLFKFILAYTQPQERSGPFVSYDNGYRSHIPILVVSTESAKLVLNPRSSISLCGSMTFHYREGNQPRVWIPSIFRSIPLFQSVEFSGETSVHILQLTQDIYCPITTFPDDKTSITLDIEWKELATPRSISLGLAGFLQVADMCELIDRQLDLQSINALRATCKAIRNNPELDSLAVRRLRNALTRIFVEDSSSSGSTSHLEDFEAILRATGAVVGGSTPLHVLCPGPWFPGDLDIIVDDLHWTVVDKFLTGRAGFVLDSERSDKARNLYPGGRNGDRIRFNYFHYNKPEAGAPGIDLCVVMSESDSSRPSHFVFTYHSTVVMNFWDGYHLYCLWPDLTFNNLLIRNEHTPTPRVDKAIKKYRDRGWKDKYDPSGLLVSDSVDPIDALHFDPVHLQDIYPSCAHSKLGIQHVPKPIWREPLTLSTTDDPHGAVALNI